MSPPFTSPGSTGSPRSDDEASTSPEHPEDTPLTQLFNSKITYLEKDRCLSLDFTAEEKMWMVTKMKEGCSPFEDGRLGCDNNPVMMSLRAGREDLVKFLVENTRRHSGKLRMKALKKCLTIAAQHGQATSFVALLESCDVKKLRTLLNSYGAYLLCLACSEGLDPDLKLVFSWDGEFKVKAPNHPAIAQYLLYLGVNINYPFCHQPPFIYAARRNPGNILLLLRDNGADVHSYLHTALAHAFYYGNLIGFNVLLDMGYGLDPNLFRRLFSHVVWPHTLLGYMVTFLYFRQPNTHYSFVKTILNHPIFWPHTSDFYLVNQVVYDLHLFVELVTSGHFSPVSGVTRMFSPIQVHKGSALCNALLFGQPIMAQVCLGKNFLVPSDVTCLPWDASVRESIRSNKRLLAVQKERCLSILDRMETTVPTLFRLTLISLCANIGVRNDRKEVIENLELPDNAKNALLFKDSSISCYKFAFDKSAWTYPVKMIKYGL